MYFTKEHKVKKWCLNLTYKDSLLFKGYHFPLLHPPLLSSLLFSFLLWSITTACESQRKWSLTLHCTAFLTRRSLYYTGDAVFDRSSRVQLPRRSSSSFSCFILTLFIRSVFHTFLLCRHLGSTPLFTQSIHRQTFTNRNKKKTIKKIEKIKSYKM